MDATDIDNRFAYHAPDGTKAGRYAFIREHAQHLALMIDANAPDSREKSLAVTALEECMMWTNAAIARHPEVSAGT